MIRKPTYEELERRVRSLEKKLLKHEKVEEALRDSEARYRGIIENILDVYYRTEKTGKIIMMSPSGLDLLGYDSESDLIGKDIAEALYFDPEEREKILSILQTNGKVKDFEVTLRHKDGNPIPISVNSRYYYDEQGNILGIEGIVQDIRERKLAEEALRKSEERYRELSNIDDLTQLYNVRHFYVELKKETVRSDRYDHPLTLLLLDLDDFKAFNDTYGHVKGDHVLLRLGQVLKKCQRRTDSAYRYGGEEFTIIMPMTTSENGAVIAERIRRECRKEVFFPAPGKEVHMTVSIGVAQYKPQEDMKTFVNRVDQLMYQAKKNGKDRVCSGS